ncbi:MAG TPA: hypothetical protein VFB38_09280 [Chthonomonadaceae bacterium]|nr:hypothetical protein [Chthonomonadaceae bacterium]
MERKPSIAWMVACSALPILWSVISPPVLRVCHEASLSWQAFRHSFRRRRQWTIRGSWKA